MASKVYTVPYRRKREGRTDYKKRMKLLLGMRPRLVVRRSLKHMSMQIINYEPKGDKVIASAHSNELKKLGWKAGTGSISAAYLTGLLLAKKAGQKLNCVLDMGQHTSVKGSVLYGAVRGAREGGLDIPCADEVLPSDARVNGKHIAEHAKVLKAEKEKYERQFSAYIKANVDPEQLPAYVDEIKAKIGGK